MVERLTAEQIDELAHRLRGDEPPPKPVRYTGPDVMQEPDFDENVMETQRRLWSMDNPERWLRPTEKQEEPDGEG